MDDIDVNVILARFEEDRQEAEESAKTQSEIIFDKLKELEITSVTVYFDGCGDSGEIHWVEFTPELDDNSFSKEIEDWAYDVLEGTGVDWYNNEGGFGTIVLDVNARTYSFDVNQRTIDSFCAASDTIEVE